MVETRRVIAVLALAGGVCAGMPVSSAAPALKLVPYAGGFTSPVGFVQDPTDPQVQFVIEQAGRIRTLVGGVVQPTPFLDIRGQIGTGGERGLLGLAFPPDAATSGRCFIYFTNTNGDIVVSRVNRSTGDARVLNFGTGRRDLVWSTRQAFISHPDFANHNGGSLAFGPDGFLYIGTGDGGSGNDPHRNAQNPGVLLGKILRIDVSVPDSNADGFVVPSSNPFVANAAYRPEIWDIGVRNPWRFSFDRVGPGATNALIIGDVGQGAWEEVDYEPAGRGGRNYGWVVREGANPTPGITGVVPAFEPMMDPVWQYSHAVGQSVTGGYMYRGASMPGYRGRYFFADFITGHVYSAAVIVDGSPQGASFSDVVDHTAQFDAAVRPINVSSFGLNSAGELFLVDYSRGAVLRFTQGPPSAPTGVRIIR